MDGQYEKYLDTDKNNQYYSNAMTNFAEFLKLSNDNLSVVDVTNYLQGKQEQLNSLFPNSSQSILNSFVDSQPTPSVNGRVNFFALQSICR